MNKDYYQTLGISKSATQDEIKKAYRRLALKHHPDRGGGDGEKFKEINEAYQILSDPQKRRQYDTFGSAFGGGSAGFGAGQTGGFGGFDFGGFSGGAGPAPGWDFGDLGDMFGFSARGGSAFGGGGLGDIFGDFFSQAFSTVQAEVEITPTQAVLGDKLQVKVAGETIDFEIPPGTQDGTQFRFRGKGRRMRNGEKGDLVLAVRVKMPERLTKEQKDLWEKLKDLESHKRTWWQR